MSKRSPPLLSARLSPDPVGNSQQQLRDFQISAAASLSLIHLAGFFLRGVFPFKNHFLLSLLLLPMPLWNDHPSCSSAFDPILNGSPCLLFVLLDQLGYAQREKGYGCMRSRQTRQRQPYPLLSSAHPLSNSTHSSSSIPFTLPNGCQSFSPHPGHITLQRQQYSTTLDPIVYALYPLHHPIRH